MFRWKRWLKLEMLAAALLLIPIGGLFYGFGAVSAAQETELAGYATSLRGRTAAQSGPTRQKAAQAINGKIIAPGATFSYNQTVKSWSWDAGYVKAPVSYDGELVKAYGGGVCQTSTTLYNAALLAGLPIVERHAHTFAPHYVPPGRDAAVAQYDIDLRFQKPLPLAHSFAGRRGRRPIRNANFRGGTSETHAANRDGDCQRDDSESPDSRRDADIGRAGITGIFAIRARLATGS